MQKVSGLRLVSRGGAQLRRVGILLGFAVALQLSACKGKTEQERLREADKQLADRNIPGAMILYKDFLKKYPNSPNATLARFGLAQSHFMDRDYARAREILDEAIIQAGGVDTQYGLNAAMLKLDTYEAEKKPLVALEEAVRTSDSLRSVAPIYHQFFQLRTARLYAMNDKDEEALKIYDSLLARPAASQDYHLESLVQSSLLYGLRNETPKGIDLLKQYLDTHAESPLQSLIHAFLAKLLLQEGSKEEADEHFDLARGIIEKKIDAAVGAEQKSALMFDLAQIEETRGDREEARKIYQQVIDQFPMGRHRPAAMIHIAQTWSDAGDSDKAIEMLNTVVKTYPKSQPAAQAYRRIQEIRIAKSADGATTGSLAKESPSNENGATSASLSK